MLMIQLPTPRLSCACYFGVPGARSSFSTQEKSIVHKVRRIVRLVFKTHPSTRMRCCCCQWISDDEVGVIGRLGKFHGVAQPGFKCLLWPIDTVSLDQKCRRAHCCSRSLSLSVVPSIIHRRRLFCVVLCASSGASHVKRSPLLTERCSPNPECHIGRFFAPTLSNRPCRWYTTIRSTIVADLPRAVFSFRTHVLSNPMRTIRKHVQY